MLFLCLHTFGNVGLLDYIAFLPEILTLAGSKGAQFISSLPRRGLVKLSEQKLVNCLEIISGKVL